jgi:hypothetical protein
VAAAGANSYTFFPGGMGQNPVYLTPVNNTTVIVSGSVGNCVRSASVTLTVVPDFTLEMWPSDYYYCLGDTFFLSASGASNYTFNPGGVTTNPAYMVFNGPEVYTVTGMNDPNCPHEATVAISSAQCNYVGISKYNKGDVRVFPNPANGQLHISADAPLKRVAVVNQLGIIIYETNEPTTSLSTAQWPAGIYFLSADSGNEKQTFKILVQ